MTLLPIAQHSTPITSTNDQNIIGNIIEEEDVKAWNDLTRHGFEDAYKNYKEHLGHFYLYFTGKKYKDNFTAIDAAEKSLKGKYFEFAADWKNSKPKINTLQGGIFICLNTTIDPPDLPRMGNPRAISEGWINPYEHRGTHIQAASLVADIICKQYKSITLKTNFKPFPDAIIDDIKKVLNQWRRNYRDTLNSTGVTNRYLFHYNGHGVPAPTESGELWVFNRHYSQYIPVPVSDLQTWLGAPLVFVFDCSKAGYLVNCFKQSAQLKIDNYNDYMKQMQEQQNNPKFHNMDNQQQQNHYRQHLDHYDSDGLYYNDNDNYSMHTNGNVNQNNNSNMANMSNGMHPSNPSYLFDCYQFAACQADELLPTAPELPADLFTCCMTSPIEISVKFFLLRNQEFTKYFEGLFNRDTNTLSSDFKYKSLKLKDFDVSYFKRTSDKKDQIADLLYIYTSITDTIAYTSVPRSLFRRCFRLDNTVTVLFRNFFLAQRIMKYYNCKPISEPQLPDCHEHELWKHWDMAIDHFLTSLIELRELNPQKSVSVALAEAPRYIFSNFFDSSLDYLKNWIQYGSFTMVPPPQLTLILQLLLTPKYRARALKLLAFFVDLGPWAVSLALNIGVFPYVVKLLQSPVVQLKPMLTFVWCKLLACDYKNMQYELYASNGGCFKYFYYILLPNEEKLNDIQMKHKSAYFESIDRQSKEQKRIVGSIGRPSLTVFKTNDKAIFNTDADYSLSHHEKSSNSETEKNIKLMSMGGNMDFTQLFNESKNDAFEMVDDDDIYIEETEHGFTVADFENLPHKWIDFEKDKGFTKYHLTTALVVLTLFIKDFNNARERLVDVNLYIKVIELIEKGRKTSRQLQLWGALFLSECWKDCIRAKLVCYEANILPRLISVFNDEISISDLRAAIIRCFTNFLTVYPEGDTTIKTTKEQDQLETRLAEEVMSATYDASLSVRKEMVIFLSTFVYKHLPLFKLAAYASMQEEIVLVEAHNDLFEFRSKTKIYGTVFSAAWKAILILSSDSHDEVQNKSEQIIIYVFNSLRSDSNLKEPFEFCYDYLVEKSLNHDRNSRSGVKNDNDDSRSVLDVQLSRLSSKLSGTSESGRRVASAYGSIFGEQNGSDSDSVHSSHSGMQALSISKFIKTMAGYGIHHGSHENMMKTESSNQVNNKPRSNSFGSSAGTHFKSIQPSSYSAFDSETYGSLPHPLPPRFTPMQLESEKPVIPIKSGLLEFATEYYQYPQLSSWPENDPLIDEFDIKFGKWRQSRNDACIADSQRDKQLSVTGDWSIPLTTIDTTSKIFEFTQFDSFLVTSDGKDVINVWDYEKNESCSRFSNNNPVGTKISQLQFMNEDDVPILIVGSNDGTVKLYNNFCDLNRCRLISSWQTLSNMTWSNNGTNFVFEWVQARGDLIATGNVKTINLWNALREQCYKTIPKRSPLPITSLTCDQLEGQIIVAGFSNGDIRVYDKRCKARQEMVKEWLSNKADKSARSSINNLHLQRGGYRELVSGSNNGLVELWDIRLMDPVETFSTGPLLKSMKVHEHAPIIATGSDCVKIWSNAGYTISDFYNDSRNPNLNTKSYFGNLYNGISRSGFSSHKGSYITNIALHPHKMIIAASSSSEPLVNIFQATSI